MEKRLLIDSAGPLLITNGTHVRRGGHSQRICLNITRVRSLATGFEGK